MIRSRMFYKGRVCSGKNYVSQINSPFGPDTPDVCGILYLQVEKSLKSMDRGDLTRSDLPF